MVGAGVGVAPNQYIADGMTVQHGFQRLRPPVVRLDALIARFGQCCSLPVLLGDADSSGSIGITDAVLTLRYAMGLVSANALNLINADISNDGSITMSDAVMILRLSIGL